MFVVTTRAGGVAAGCLVGFASQTSIHPPRFLVGLSKKNHTFRVAGDATHLAVHVFDHDHLDTVELFGTQTGDTTDKFDRCSGRLNSLSGSRPLRLITAIGGGTVRSESVSRTGP
nr:flavin reductase [Mycobacterium sp. E2989]